MSKNEVKTISETVLHVNLGVEGGTSTVAGKKMSPFVHNTAHRRFPLGVRYTSEYYYHTDELEQDTSQYHTTIFLLHENGPQDETNYREALAILKKLVPEARIYVINPPNYSERKVL